VTYYSQNYAGILGSSLVAKKQKIRQQKVTDKNRRKSKQKGLSKSKSTCLVDEPGTSVAATITLPILDSIPPQMSPNEYEYSECLGTYSEDMAMGNGAEWLYNVAVDSGYMKTVLIIQRLAVMILKGCAQIVFCNTCTNSW